MFENLHFKTKIALVAIALSVVAIGGTAFLVYNQATTNARYRNFINIDDRGTLILTRMADKINALLYATHRMVDQTDPAALAEIATRFQADEAGTRALLADAVRVDPRLDRVVAPFAERFEQVQSRMDQVLLSVQKGDLPTAHHILTTSDADGVRLAIDIGALAGERVKGVEAASGALAHAARVSAMLCVAVVLVLIGLVFVISLVMSGRSIVSPLLQVRDRMLAVADGQLEGVIPCLDRGDEVGAMAKALRSMQAGLLRARSLEAGQAQEREEIARERAAASDRAARDAAEERHAVEAIRKGLAAAAEGNLAYRIDVEFPERLQPMRNDFNESFSKLRQTFSAVQHGVLAIGSGASEISTASADMSRRTEHQAASIEESSVALGRVAGMLRDSADSAGRAASVTDEARDGAEKSGTIVHAAVNAMSHIESSFAQISQVIGLIDDIAFQTNLLALNAGIEAARAGDAGRGFAVVATEVRTLAQRSAEGARQVKELVSNSGTFVTDGVRLVRDAGGALEVILGQVAEINKLVAAIAHASVGQSAAVEEINIAVGEMTKSTQQNAAMVEESTAAIASLDQEAVALRDRVAFFRLGEDHSVMTHAAPRPAVSHMPITPKASRPARPLVLADTRAQDDAGWADFM